MDLITLHALSDRGKFQTLKHVVPAGMLSDYTETMLDWFDMYFSTFPDRERIEWDELKSLIKLRAGGVSKESLALTMQLVKQLQDNPPDAHAIDGIVGKLYELDLSGRAGAIIEKYNAGGDIDLGYELLQLSQRAVRNQAQVTPFDYIDTPIQELLAEIEKDDVGLKFRRLPALGSHILGLLPGSSVAIGARPDKGKTSFIASTLTDFAPQVVELYKGKRPILWLNNEGSGKRIIPRLYQAALGLDLSEIIKLSNQDKLIPRYRKVVGGVQDIIRVKDMHGASLAQIEQILEAQKPAVCVADMLGNFRLGTSSGGGNKAEVIEQIWQEWREMMVRHDCVGLATVQISVEGENMFFPPYSALKDSKTAIQGATDVIIMMGNMNASELREQRGFSIPKNKFQVPKKPSSVEFQVHFDAARCLFTQTEI